MKDYDLDEEEQQILDDYEADQFVDVPNFRQEKARAEASAKASLNKTKNINIRLSIRDLYKLKAKAMEEGIPYQTLASSILHKATTR
ncbi:MAG TPA: hypothetical protein VGS08_05880 [Candidatus Saccharimonadales bacterium]|nr:hypothetical protein [Candidatus Saccharimonadales bacterium]